MLCTPAACEHPTQPPGECLSPSSCHSILCPSTPRSSAPCSPHPSQVPAAQSVTAAPTEATSSPVGKISGMLTSHAMPATARYSAPHHCHLPCLRPPPAPSPCSQDGTVHCSPLPCPPISCSRPESTPGQCCPRCPGRWPRCSQALPAPGGPKLCLSSAEISGRCRDGWRRGRMLPWFHCLFPLPRWSLSLACLGSSLPEHPVGVQQASTPYPCPQSLYSSERLQH